VLVVAQVAFSVVLAVLAFLFGHSLSTLRSTDLGFRNLDVVAFSLDLPGEWKAEDRLAVRRRMMTQLESMPGVSGVSFAFPGPYLAGTASATVRVAGSPSTANEAAWVNMGEVGPRYFTMLGGAPVEGREFDRSDDAAAPAVALVNQAFLKKFLPEERHPLQRVLSTDPRKPPIHIVGVVRDILHNGLREKPEPEVYLPAAMDGTWGIILVESQLPRDVLVGAIRRETARLGPQVNAGDPRTIRQAVDDSIFQERMLATLSGCFGGLTLLLAALGLYGVVAYATTQRAAEIGIRIALGAQRSAVAWMVLRGSLLLVGVGLAIGMGASLAAARYVSSVLYGIGPNDPLAFAATAAVLLAVGVAAAFLPARRSSTMDPMRALRHE
jgi:predicted permease